MGKKRNLKEHLTDDTLDLSLSELQTVPVKEIAAIPKATCLDLSSNQLTSLGLNFASSLVHLVKLDLCRNQLTELPENFGLLVNLKYLDLYRNKLQTLPLSFCNLKHLRWLDLKENPLVPKLMQICGPCLDAQGCQSAARNVVKFLGQLSREVENEKLKKEAQEKKLQAIEKELLEKTQKKESKKKKKKKNTAKQIENTREDLKENGSASNEMISDSRNEMMRNMDDHDDNNQKYRKVFSFIWSFLQFCLFMSLFMAFSFYIIYIYDEESSQKIMMFIKTTSSTCATVLPKWILVYWQQIRTLVVLFLVNLVTVSQLSFKALMELYYFVEEETSLSMNLHILYIKVADMVIHNYEKLSSYIVNIIQGT